MKINKLMIVTLLLLAIFAIGAVSASEDTDTLAVEDTDDLSVDESPVIADYEETYDDLKDIRIYINEGSYSTTEAEPFNSVINIETPIDCNGSVAVLCGDDDLFVRSLDDFNPDRKNTGDGINRYWITNDDLGFFNGHSSEEIIEVKFVTEYDRQFSKFGILMFEDDSFRIEENQIDVSIYPEGPERGPLYIDSNFRVMEIGVHDPMMAGTFYVTANNMEYIFEATNFDDGEPWKDWLLSSFNITQEGNYTVVFEYSPLGSDARRVVSLGLLEVHAFNNDAFRIVENKPAHLFTIFCPEGTEGSKISISLTNDWEEENPPIVMNITVAAENCGEWINLTFEEIGLVWDDDNIIDIKITYGDTKLLEYETGFWYDNEIYEPPVQSDLLLYMDFHNTFLSENIDDPVMELYIPENFLIFGGNITITSNGRTIFSREITLQDMDYNYDGRFYQYNIIYEELTFDEVNSGDIITFAFLNDVKNITQSVFYLVSYDEDEESEVVKFRLVNFKDGNYLDDEVLIEIVDFPMGVADEFKVIVDKWGDETELTFKISELAKNEKGFYVFTCSDLDIDDFMSHMTDAGISFRLVFSNDEQIEGDCWVYKDPCISSGEVSIDEEEPVIEFISLPDELEGSIIISIQSINGNRTIKFDTRAEIDEYLTEPEEEEEYDEDYEPHQRWVFALQDLGITDKGTYVLKVEMTKNGQQVSYNNTIEVVDFVIDARNNLDQITSAAFRILLDEDASGNVLIYVDENLVFNQTLEWIGYSDWNRMGGFNIPLNYLQITESGLHDIKLLVQVNDGDKIVERELNHNINVTVAPNSFAFGDIMYLSGEGNFLYPTSLSYPVPIDSEFVLYLNDALAGRIKIGCDDFKFRDLDASLLDEFGALKPGLYNARLIRVSEQGNMTCAEGSFEVKTVNGDFVVDVTPTATTLDGISVEITAPPLPHEWDTDNLGLVIFINPYLNEDGELDYEDIVEMWGWELVEYLEENSAVEIGMLPAGTNNLLVQYSLAVDDIEYAMQNPFYSNVLTVNVKKINTQIYASAVSAVYRVAKKLVITLKDANGKALVGKKVTIKIGTITKTLTTNRYGQVSLLVSSLVPKSYTAAIRFAGDRFYLGSAKNVKVLVIKAKTALAGKNLKVKAKVSIKKVTAVLKYNGKYVLGSKYVTLKINNKLYKVKTNAKGQAIFKVNNLKRKGSYIGVLMFKADYYFKASSNKVRVVVV